MTRLLLAACAIYSLASSMAFAAEPLATAISDSREAFVGNLVVELDGLKSDKGQVCLALYDRSKGFPNDGTKAKKYLCADITARPLKVTFEGLEFTNYAVAVIHDENKDGKLNTGTFGIPTEGFGFSNNPAVRMGAPEYSECSFFVAGKETVITITMRNL